MIGQPKLFGGNLEEYIEVGIAVNRHDLRECSGSVVECLTRYLGAEGLSLTGVTALWSLSKTHLS